MKVNDPQDTPLEQWRPGVETRMLASASNGAAQLCIFEQWIAPGTGAPTHSHPVEEVLTVREGEAEMWLDQERVIVTAGQSLIVPANTVFAIPAPLHYTCMLCWRRRCLRPRPRARRNRCEGGVRAMAANDKAKIIRAIFAVPEIARDGSDLRNNSTGHVGGTKS